MKTIRTFRRITDLLRSVFNQRLRPTSYVPRSTFYVPLRPTLPVRALVVALTIGFLIANQAQAASGTWDGGAANGSGSWSTPANWNPDGNPANGATLSFGAGGTSGTSLNTGTFTSVGGLTFTASTAAYAISQGTGGTLTLSGGIQQLGTVTVTMSNGMTLSAGNTMNVSQATGGLTLAGILYGTGSITKSGSGRLRLSGTLSFTGPVAINAGTLLLDKSGTYTLANNATGSGSFILAGTAATSNLTGNWSAFAGDITIQSGGRWRSNAGTSTSAMADWTIDGILSGGSTGSWTAYLGSLAGGGSIFAGSALTGLNVEVGGNNHDSTFLGTMSNGVNGVANFTKVGTGALTLSGANVYTGSTAIKNGSVTISGANNRLPTGTTVTLGDSANSGRLQLGDSGGARDQQLAGLLTSGSGTANAVVGGNAGVSTLSLNIVSGTDTYGGTLGGASANENKLALVKTGSGSLALSGANTYTGGTTISAGTLSVGTINASGAGGLGSLSASSGTLTLSGGVLRYAGTGATISSPWQLVTATGSGIDVSNALTITTDNTAATTGSLTKSGAGILTLSGNNTYSGATTISGGTLVMSGASSSTSVITINGGTGTTLLVTNAGATGSGAINTVTGVTTPNLQFHIDGGGTIPLLNALTGNSSIVTTIDVNNNGGSGSGGIIQLNGTIGNSAVGNATYNITGGNSYSLYIANLRAAGGSSGSITLNPTTAALSLGSLTGGAVNEYDYTWVLDGTNPNNSVTGVISDQTSSKTSAVTKSNSSTWTLTGNNTYTGATTISGGTLSLGTTGSIGQSQIITVGSAGVFDVSGLAAGFTLNANQVLNGTGAVKGDTILSGILSPGSSPGSITISGNATYTAGGTYVWEVNRVAGTGSQDANKWTYFDQQIVTGMLTLNSTGSYTIAITGLNGSSQGGVRDWNPHSNYQWTIATTSPTGTLTAGGGTFNLDTSDFENNNGMGGGTFSLTPTSGANGYLTLAFNGSTLSANSYWAPTGGTGTWNNSTPAWTYNAAGTGGSLSWNTASAPNYDTAIFGADTAGSLAYTATVSGSVTANGITVRQGAPTLTGGSITLTGGTLTSNSGSAATINTILAGSHGLTKEGTGILVLGGTNTYAGDTTVNAGTLKAGVNNAVTYATGDDLVVNGGTFDLAGFDVNINGLSAAAAGGVVTSSAAGSVLTVGNNSSSGIYSGLITGGANLGLTKLGTGTQSLGTISYTGTTTIDQGTITLTGNSTAGALVFGATAGSSNLGRLNLSSANGTFTTLTVQTGTTTANIITIGSGKVLTLTTGLNVGVAGDDTALTLTGTGGILGVGTGDATDYFYVGKLESGTSTLQTVDMRTLGTFTANVGTFTVGESADNRSQNARLYLADYSSIRATTLYVGKGDGGNGGGGPILYLSNISNVINANTILVGEAKATTAKIQFDSTGGSLTLRGSGGGSVTTFTIGLRDTTQSSDFSGNVDFSNGQVDALINTMYVGRETQASGYSPASGIGNFSMGSGAKGTLSSVTVNNLYIGYGSGVANLDGLGTVTLNGGTLNAGTISMAAPTTTDIAVLTINNGTLNVTTGGIIGGSGASTINLNGGVLNMGGFNIGSSSVAVDTFNYNAGTLANFGSGYIGALVNDSDSATPNTIAIAANETLTINGTVGLTVGVDTGTHSTSKLTISGSGSLLVANTSAYVTVGLAQGNPDWSNTSVLDLSGLASVTLGSSGTPISELRIAYGQTASGTLKLSNTAATITAATIRIGDSTLQNPGSGYLTLGTGNNDINADTIYVGMSKAAGTLKFVSQTFGSSGSVTIRSKNNSALTMDMNLAIANIYTTGDLTGLLDLRGHVADVSADTLTISSIGPNQTGSGDAIGTVSFDTGTFTVNTLNMAAKAYTGSGTAYATLNIGGGTFTVNNTFTLASQTGSGAASGTLTITGGRFISNANIVDGGTTTTSTINLQGGTLEMSGKNIGSAASPISNLSFQVGTLQNVGSINGTAGVTKNSAGSLSLAGVNNFSGGATLTTGQLNINSARALGTGAFTIANGTTIDNTSGGAVQITSNNPQNWTGNFTFAGDNGSLSALNLGTSTVALGASSRTATIADSTLTVGGTISGSVGVGLTKAGGGTLTLSGNNTYTGATTINAGVLALSGTGSISGSPTISVANGATFNVAGLTSTFNLASNRLLAGSGAGTFNVAGNIKVGGTISMGTTGIGTMAVNNGTVTFINGGHYVWDIGTVTAGGGDQTANKGVNYDTLSINGKLNLGSLTAGGFTINIDSLSGNAPANWSPHESGTWTLASTTGFLGTFNSGSFTVVSSSPLMPSNNFTVTANGNNLLLTYTGDTDTPAGNYWAANTGTWDSGTTWDWSYDLTGSPLAKWYANDNAIFSATGSGVGSFTVNVAGDVSANQITVGSGQPNFTAGTITLSGGTITINSGSTTTIGSVIAGNNLTKAGTGLLVLSGANTYDGVTTISSGVLQLFGAANRIKSGTDITITGRLDMNGQDQTFNSVTGTGSLTTGGGALTIGSGGANGTFSGVISENGTLTKTGAGILTLSGANTYTGATYINVGTVRAQNNAAFGTITGATTISSGAALDVGGTLTADTLNLGAEVFYVSGSGVGGNGAIINSSGSQQINVFGRITLVGDATFGGTSRWDIRSSTPTLNMGGFKLTKTGANAIALVGATVSNPGSIEVGSGTFSIQTTTAMNGSSANSITVDTGAKLDFYAETVATAWSVVLQDGSTVSASSGSGANNTLSGPVILNGAANFNTATFVLSSSGTIGGTGSLTKTGSGTLTLSGANAYSGGTTINGGILRLSGGADRLLTGGTVTIGSGTATFDVNGQSQTIAALFGTNNGSITLGTGTLTLNQGATISSSFNGVISGTSGQLILQGGGTLTLGGANTYTGGTTIDNATLKITTANAGSGALTFGATAGGANVGALDLNGAGFTATSLKVQTDSTSANTITIGSGRTLSITGGATIGFNSAAFSTTKLTVSGSGSFSVVSGNNNFQIGGHTTSDTFSNGATLDMNGLANFVANLGTATFRIGDSDTGVGTITGSTLILAQNSTITAGTLTTESPDGSVTEVIKLGTGSNAINADTIMIGLGAGGRANGSLSFYNPGSGTLTIRSRQGSLTTANMYVAYGAFNTGYIHSGTVDLTGRTSDVSLNSLNVGGRTGAGGSDSTGRFLFDTGTLTVNSVTLGLRSSGGSISSGSLSIGGGIANIGSITMGSAGAGTANGYLVVSGGALFTMNGNINRGSTTGTSGAYFNLGNATLKAGSNFAVGSGITMALTGNATLDSNGNTMTISSAMSGNGFGITKISSGSVILTAANTYTGTTAVNVGTLTLSGAGAIDGSPTISVASGATFNVLNVSGGTFTLGSGQLLGGTGAGTFNVVGKMIVGGTLSPGGSGAIGAIAFNTSTVTFSNGGKYEFSMSNSGSAAGVGYDTLSGITTLNLGSLTAGGFTVNVDSLGTHTANWNPHNAGTWTLASFINLPVAFNAGSFTLNVGNFTAYNILGTSGTLTLKSNASSLYLDFNGVSTPVGSFWATNTGTWDGTAANWSYNQSGSPTGVFAANDDAIFSATGFGSGAFTVNVNGTVIANSLSITGTPTFSGGTITLGNSSTIIAGTTGGITVASGSSATISSALTSPTGIGLTIAGGGKLTLNAANSFANGASITAGTVAIGNNNALGTAAQALTFAVAAGTLQSSSNLALSNSTITLNAVAATMNITANSLSITGAISGNGSLTKTGTGTLTLSGANTYGGATVVQGGGRLVVSGTGAISPTTGAALTLGANSNSGVLQYDSSATSKFGAINVGNGSNNSGTANQTDGTITGTSLSLATGLGNGIGAVNLSGGSMVISGAASIGKRNSSATPVASTLTLTGAASFSATSMSLATDSGYNAAGTVTQEGTSTVNLVAGAVSLAGAHSGNNTHTGTYNLNGGTLTAGSVSMTAATGTGTSSGAFYFNGGTLKAGQSNTGFMPVVTGFSAKVQSGGAKIDTGTFAITIAAALTEDSGSTGGGLTYTGTGVLTLSGANSFSGGLSNNGTGGISLANSTAAGAGTIYLNSLQTSTGMTLGLTGGIAVSNPIVMDSSTGRETINSTSGNNTLSGGLTITGSSSHQLVLQSNTAGNNFTITGGVSGVSYLGNVSLRGVATATGYFSGVVTIASEFQNNGTANWTLSTAGSSWTATDFISSGNFILGVDNALATNASITWYTGDVSGSLDMNGHNQAVTGLQLASTTSTPSVFNDQATLSTLTIGNSSGGNYTYDGTIGKSGTGTNIALIKTGTNTQTLSGANSYTGGTTINGGTLQMGTSTALGAVTGTLTLGSGTAVLNMMGNSTTVGVLSGISGGTITVGNSGSTATLTVNQLASSYTFSGVMDDNGTLSFTKGGGGTLTLTGNNTYRGGTTVSGGTLLANSASATGSGNVTVDSGATLGGNGTLAGRVTVNNGGTLAPGAAGSPVTMTVGGLTLASSAHCVMRVANDASHDMIVSTGAVDLGGATLTLDTAGFAVDNTSGIIWLIHNTSGSAVSGTFSATTVTLPNGEWTITTTADYEGGKSFGGDDVALIPPAGTTYMFQ